MAGYGELSFGLADLYPNMGFMTTRDLSLPEPDDQKTLVDDQALAEKHDTTQDPMTSKGMWIGLSILVAIMVIFSIKI
jgi:hypothetical protein